MDKLFERSYKIKQEARRLGFDHVGIAKAKFLKEDAIRMEAWLKNMRNGEMGYLENHFDKRVDPRKLVENAKSVISLAYNYHTDLKQLDASAPKISKYAYGEDYHLVIKEKLREFQFFIQQEFGNINVRGFVDSAPVLERSWARESGLGWIGKHGLLIVKQEGSSFFLAELILDLELHYDHAIDDFCGTCTKCIDACPTQAILPDKELAADRCISYLTIELKKEFLPEEFKGKMEGWAYGCDICQDVCPWNRFGKQHQEPRFNPKKDLLTMNKDDWYSLEKDTYNELFRKSAVKRTKFTGLSRNIQFIKT